MLIININNKIILFYLLSNNFINKIINAINNDFLKYDEDFLSYYVNFLKSISLKIDLTTLPFFFLNQINSFPLLEIALSLYNHQDKMIQSVIKNIVLIILKLKYQPLIDYLCGLPSLTYFSFICCRIKDLLILISKESNYEQYKTLQEDIVDEVLFIQDIFCLKIDKINHIMVNSLFSYCILPYVLNIKFDKIKLEIKLYFLNVLFISIQDESFLNILLSILFFPSLTIEINNMIKNNVVEPDNYFYNWSDKNNTIQLSSQSFSNYIKYNFNSKTLKYIFSMKDEKFPEISTLIEKFKSKSIDNNENATKEIINEILNYFSSQEKKNIFDYKEHLSIGTGINCLLNENHLQDINDRCFTKIMEKFFIIYFDKSLELKSKLIDNDIKIYIFSLININQRNNNILFLICLLLRNLLKKNNDNISKFLEKNARIISGNNMSEDEINDVIKINNDNKTLNSILINDQFQEVEEDEDEDEDYEKKIENMEKKKIISEKENEKIKKSIFINNSKNIQAFDNKFFDNIEKNISEKSNNYYYYYNTNLIEILCDLLNIKNNLNPIIFKCYTDIILSFITKKKDNKTILFCSPVIKSKIGAIYIDFKNCIINNYKNNKNFHLYAYSKFRNQYAIFLSLLNFDYDNIIKEGFIILNKNLLNYNVENTNDPFIESIIIGKNYKTEEEKEKEKLNNIIINFFIIHDLYYIISNDKNEDIEKDLLVNNYSLKFDELAINQQYFLCDLKSDIKYFPCKCKINKNNKVSNNYLDSILLLYENNLYIGNSSSNPNYTRIIDKYSISNCSVDNHSTNNVDLYIIEDDNSSYIEISLIFADYQLVEKIIKIMNEEIKLSRQREKQKFKEFLHKLKK